MTLRNISRARCSACPLIVEDDGERPVWRFSIDGNFSLNRKNKGIVLECTRETEFFCDQSAVDEYVKKEKKSEKKCQADENLCSNFSAGDIRVAASRNRQLTTKGTFGSCCNHMFPLKFLDMKYGERLAYAKFLLRDISKDTPNNILLLPNYDIACNFVRHLKRKVEVDLLNSNRFQYFIPEMHSNAHIKKCKLEYSPRILGTCGMADGEAIERLWSIVGRTAKSMKEMTATNRVAFFDDLLYELGMRINGTLELALIQTYLKLDNIESEAKQKLQLLVKGNHMPEVTEEWREELIEKLSVSTKKPQEIWEWKYVALLEKHEILVVQITDTPDDEVLSLQKLSEEAKRCITNTNYLLYRTVKN